MTISRRKLLQGALAAGAALPVMWIPRYGRAVTSAFAQVDHLLVLFAQGGFRSHATFNAVGAKAHNPFGTQAGAPGTEWALGAACGSDPIPYDSEVLPSFAELTNRVAVVASVDHRPNQTLPIVDHLRAIFHIGSGGSEPAPGLLTLIGARHPLFVDGFVPGTPPPVEIGSGFTGAFGRTTRDLLRSAPLSLPGAFGGGRVPRLGPGSGLRRALDEAHARARPAAFAARLDQARVSNERLDAYGPLLSSPALDVLGAPEARGLAFSNRELLQILGDATTVDPALRPFGPDVALAYRMLEAGSPACVVARNQFDFHAGERRLYPLATRDLVRQLAGLHALLGRTPHPKGGSYFDRSLVVVLSEFSRNNANPETGFNSAEGSDHVEPGDAPQRHQAIAFMGGVVKGGRLLGATDAQMQPLDQVYPSRALLSTLLDVLGIDYRRSWSDPPIAGLFA